LAAATLVPIPPREVPRVPETIFDASRYGMSAAASGRKVGAPDEPLGPAKTALAAALVAPNPPLATESGPPLQFASPTDDR